MPRFPAKYVGDLAKITYRSSWELQVMKFLDRNPHVSRWGSEPFPIPYWSPIDRAWHKYYVDFWVEVSVPGKPPQVSLLEIKPLRDGRPPPKNCKSRTYVPRALVYIKNQAKWDAAKKLCDEKGWTFRIVTEKDLRIDT